MMMTKSVQSFLRSLGKRQGDFERTIIARNMYLLSNDPHYAALKQITFKTHDSGIVSHEVGQYVFFVTVHCEKVYYLNVAEKKSMKAGLADANFALGILQKYEETALQTL